MITATKHKQAYDRAKSNYLLQREEWQRTGENRCRHRANAWMRMCIAITMSNMGEGNAYILKHCKLSNAEMNWVTNALG